MTEPTEIAKAVSVAKLSPISKFHEHLRQTEPVYNELMKLKVNGWNEPEADKHFENQRQTADGASKQDAKFLYRMMQQIGAEMQETTGALLQNHVKGRQVNILDLCTAPGGYSFSALKYNKNATVSGITLPSDSGGHEVLLKDSRATVLYRDMNMFAAEFWDDKIPAGHPEYASFSTERPFYGQKFDLVLCDGQVLRPNLHQRPEYREITEAFRLTSSQLILALQRIRQGGTFIMLLRKIECMDSMELLYTFSRFSEIAVFKPQKKHAMRGTFYLIAKNVQPESAACEAAVQRWKNGWWNATFGGEYGTGAPKIPFDDQYMQEIIDSFGTKLAVLARPIWKIQLDGLKKKSWAK